MCLPEGGESLVDSGDVLDSGSCLTGKKVGGTGYGDGDAVMRVSGVLPLEGSVELWPGVVEKSNESPDWRGSSGLGMSR